MKSKLVLLVSAVIMTLAAGCASSQKQESNELAELTGEAAAVSEDSALAETTEPVVQDDSKLSTTDFPEPTPSESQESTSLGSSSSGLGH